MAGYDFSMWSLVECKEALQDTMRFATEEDKEFIKALTTEIAVRERKAVSEH